MKACRRSESWMGRGLYSYEFGVGDLVEEVSGCFPGIDERAVRDVMFLEWLMVRGVMLYGEWGEIELPGLGRMELEGGARRRYGRKMGAGDWRGMVVERDEFVSKPYEQRKVLSERFGIRTRKVDNIKVLRRRHELGVRHYVLE